MGARKRKVNWTDKQKVQVSKLAKELRDNVEVPEGISDSDLVEQVIRAEPKFRQFIDGPIEIGPADPEGSAASRFGRGAAAPLVEGVQSLVAGSFEGGRRAEDLKSKKGTVKGSAQFALEQSELPFKMMSEIAKNPSTLIGGPGVKERAKEGDLAGAAGYGTTSALAWLIGGAGKAEGAGKTAMEEMGAIGKGQKVDKAMLDIAKTVSEEHVTALNKAFETIDTTLDKQLVNVQSLRQNIQKAVKAVEKLEAAPGTQVKDVTAAKDVVARLKDRANKGMLTWPELRRFQVELDQAKQTLGPSAAKNSLDAISEASKDILNTSAKAAGQGEFYAKLVKDYRDLSNWQRAYAKILKAHTQPQVEAKLTATSAPSLRVLGSTPLRTGRSRVGKIAQTNKQMIKTAHQALDDLGTQIKKQPKGGPPPTPAPPVAPPTPPPGQPPAGGAAPPPAGGGLPPQAPPPKPAPGGAGAAAPVGAGAPNMVPPKPKPGFGTSTHGIENDLTTFMKRMGF